MIIKTKTAMDYLMYTFNIVPVIVKLIAIKTHVCKTHHKKIDGDQDLSTVVIQVHRLIGNGQHLPVLKS